MWYILILLIKARMTMIKTYRKEDFVIIEKLSYHQNDEIDLSFLNINDNLVHIDTLRNYCLSDSFLFCLTYPENPAEFTFATSFAGNYDHNKSLSKGYRIRKVPSCFWLVIDLKDQKRWSYDRLKTEIKKLSEFYQIADEAVFEVFSWPLDNNYQIWIPLADR